LNIDGKSEEEEQKDKDYDTNILIYMNNDLTNHEPPKKKAGPGDGQKAGEE